MNMQTSKTIFRAVTVLDENFCPPSSSIGWQCWLIIDKFDMDPLETDSVSNAHNIISAYYLFLKKLIM